MKSRKALILSLLSLTIAVSGSADERRSLTDSISYAVSAQASLAAGDYTPLWLNANKYGLSSLETANGYVRAAATRPLALDSARRWGVGYGVDLALAHNFTSTLIVQQAFVEVRWLKGVLTVGSKQMPMELKNNRLSSGSQTLGINARPVPQVRLALPEYWDIPFTNGWLGLKGHIAYGMTTDGKWQEEFTQARSKYTTNTFYHSKAGYLRIGKPTRPLTVELGLEMAAQFGGDSYLYVGNGRLMKVSNNKGLSSFINALIPGGADVVETDYTNSEGNLVGSWLIRANLDYDTWGVSVYADHYFEDHSSMFFLDYDGYGQGSEWNTRKESRYFMYDIKDMLLGAEMRLKRCRWIDNIVFEYLYSKYQSGPVYHDHNINISDHIGGVDDYYNHYVYTGWQHWGQVMGNPLYLSPLYNTDGTIEVKNNRFVAYHLGVDGRPAERVGYRLLAMWQRGFGRYTSPYVDPRNNFSLMAEATYDFPSSGCLAGWSVTAACGFDTGQLRGDNYGLQFTITKSGVFGLGRNKR